MTRDQYHEQFDPPDGDSRDEVSAGFVLLGLSATAGADLVDLAYDYHRGLYAGQRSGSQAIAALERVRRLLKGVTPPVTTVRPPRPAPPTHDALARPPGRGLWFSRRRRDSTSTQPRHGLTPYQMLRVDPAADFVLLMLVYRHLLRAAARANDAIAFEGLERAYALISTPNARALCDGRGVLLDEGYALPTGAADVAPTPDALTSGDGEGADAPAESDGLVPAPAGGFA